MFANRFTAFIDACTLVSALKRNLLLTLAEAEFFRVRWSDTVLDETERALVDIHSKRGLENAVERAKRVREAMEKAFEDANVGKFDNLNLLCINLPDPDDDHVLAAAVKTRADVIVTENLKDFPEKVLEPLMIESRSADAFIADTIALDPGRAVAAIRTMRMRLKNPAKTAEALLIDMESEGLVETVDVLRPHVASL
ncbi:PIN domain-containing protein [Prosthecomicrobium hirschii]|uniref:PIN domain-containing protein n=1 Tax=Prosthecodimorpha hirschii TaxID=665126 RepID=UPI0011265A79|nr:PIN domain-containing protein [Prosthecomicrobium hirschii]TPQ51526.1 PIN domain-containing protein [Prosthecomicrobium hirschii]